MHSYRRTSRVISVLIVLLLAGHTSPASGQCEYEIQEKLLAYDGADYDKFGDAVAISGDAIVIGTPGDDDSGGGSGSAYVFRYDDANETWNLEAKLLASDGAASDSFGIGVAVSGEVIAVGASGDDDQGNAAGAVYAFHYDDVGGMWIEEAKLKASDGSSYDYFGLSVSISGNVLVVGTATNSAYVFRRYEDSYQCQDNVDCQNVGLTTCTDSVCEGVAWVEETILTGPLDSVSSAVSVSGDTIVVGTSTDDDNGIEAGAAYVYRYETASKSWIEEVKLLASDGETDDYFGSAVSISGDRIAVGADGDNDRGFDSGSVYAFRYDETAGVWVEEAKLTAIDGQTGHVLGSSVSVSGSTLLAGGNSGASYLFRYDEENGIWIGEARIIPYDNGAPAYYFGRKVAVDGGFAVTGRISVFVNVPDPGAAYVTFIETTLTDGDVDGVCDWMDNCLADHNPDQSDDDGDGHGDACDLCPDGSDFDDTDFDGFVDGCDNCVGLTNSECLPGYPDCDCYVTPELCYQPDSDGNGVGDACEYGTDLRLTSITDFAGNVLESFEYDLEGQLTTSYRGTAAGGECDPETGCIAETTYSYVDNRLDGKLVFPTDGTAAPRTVKFIYDPDNPDRLIGTLSGDCGCGGSSGGNTFVYRDDRNRVIRITTTDTDGPPNFNPTGATLEEFQYVSPTDDRLTVHKRRNPHTQLLETVETRIYSSGTADCPGEEEEALVCLNDGQDFQVRKECYDSAGRLTKQIVYKDLSGACSPPRGASYVTLYDHVPLYDVQNRLIGETRTTTHPSNYKDISDWIIDAGYYEAGSTKTVTTYREDNAGTPTNVRTEVYNFNTALADYRLTETTKPTGKTIAYGYADALHPERVTSETHSVPDGIEGCTYCQQESTVTYEYESPPNDTGRVVREIRSGPDGGNVTTYYEYDEFGRMTLQIEDELGLNRDTEFVHNAFDDQILSRTASPADLVRATVYDSDGQVEHEYACEYALDLSINFTDSGAPPQECIDTTFEHTIFAYHDVSGGVISQKVPLLEAPFALDISGDYTGSTLAETTTTYDATGVWRLEATQWHDPLGTVPPPTEFEYDYQGRVVKTTSPGGTLGGITGAHVINKTVYDGRGLVKDRIVADTNNVDYLTTTTDYTHDGQINQIANPNGTYVLHLYNSFGRLSNQIRCEVANCTGISINTNFEYNDAGQVTRQYVNGISDTVTVYDDWGRAYSVRRRATIGADNASDQITLTEYNAAGNVLKTADKLGPLDMEIEIGIDQVTEYDYTDLSEVAKVTQHNLTYPEETEFAYDAAGRQTSQTVDPDPGLDITTAFEYDAMGRVTTATDPEGHYVESFFDSRGNRIRSVSFNMGGVEKAQERWKYDASGRLFESARLAIANTLETTDTDSATDQVTEFTYDHDGRRQTTTTYNNGDGATGLVTRNEYDAIGRPSKIIDPAGNYTENVYITTAGPSKPLGALDHQLIVDIPTRMRQVHFFYDTLARLIEQADQGEGSVDFCTEFEYDDADRRTLITDPEGIKTKSIFDKLGRRTQVIEAFNNALARTTDYGYDKLGRLTTITAYDHASQVTIYEYDLVGRRTKIFYPDEGSGGTPVLFEYDKAGRLIKKTDQRNVFVDYTYDKRGLLETRSTPGVDDTYLYDGLGRMTSATRSGLQGSSSVFAYNDLSQLDYEDQTLFSQPAKRMDYDYDQVGNRKMVTYPSDVGITLTMNVDALSRVEDISRGIRLTAAVQIVQYDYVGLFLSRRRLFTDYESQTSSACPVWVDYEPTYDGHRRMTNITNTVSTAVWSGRKLSNNIHTYDGVSNRTRIEPGPLGNPDGNYYSSGLQKDIQYDYDNLHRLTKATYNTDGVPAPFEQFGMDLLSNRTDYTQRDTTILSYEDNEANEYTKIGTPLPGSENVIHDAAGNLTSDERNYGYGYDFENRLIRVFRDSFIKNGVLDLGEPLLADYTYDALGRRIASTVQTSTPLTLHYYYDGQNVIAEYNANATPYLLRYFVHGTQYIDERVLMHKVKGDDDYYYFPRELWGVEGLVNNRGHEVEHYSYDAYGMPVITAVRVEDMDYDGTVGAGDLALILGNLGYDPCTQVAPIYDLNGDGVIDSRDLSAVNKAFGAGLQTIPESGIGNPYAFTARRMDFSDYLGIAQIPQLLLYHYRAREYDPKHGRFSQRDPAGYVDGMNLYEYVKSNPAQWMDPEGNQIRPSETGTWSGSLDRTVTDGGLQYWASLLDVKFRPSEKVKSSCCKEIGAIQIVRSIWDSSGVIGIPDRWNWHIDIDEELIERGLVDHPWYISSINWNRKYPDSPLNVTDEPGYPFRSFDGGYYGLPALIRQEFEVCAVCVQGKYKSERILSCFEWIHGFEQLSTIKSNGTILSAQYAVRRWASIGKSTNSNFDKGSGLSRVNFSRYSSIARGDPRWEIHGAGRRPSGTFGGLVDQFLEP